MKNILFLFLGILLVGCKVQSDITATGPESLSTPEINNTEVPIPFAIENSVQLKDSLFTSIEKGPCFGNCPTYTMNIYSNGTVVLKAVRAIDKKGLFQSQVTPEQLNRFILKAKEIGFAEMNDTYDNKSVTDLPMVKTSIVLDGKRKQVKRRYEYPKEIRELEKLFDNLLEELTWDKIQDSSNN